MTDVKVSGLPSDSALDGNHYVVLNDPTGPTTKRGLLSVLADFFFNQINIPSVSGSPILRATEQAFDHVASGMVWSGDSYAVNRNASMTAGVIYINGRRISISAVTARTFTASKDTYIDVLDNADGTGTLVYTEVANNAASPALASNSVRIGIIVTGATTIAAVGSVNQGQETKVLPIASSIPYSVTDSLGNLICPRDPQRRILGYRQLIANHTGISTTITQITGLSCPVIVPTGRKTISTLEIPAMQPAAAFGTHTPSIWSGAVNVGTKLQEHFIAAESNDTTNSQAHLEANHTPASASTTFNGGLKNSGSGGSTTSIIATSTSPAFIRVDLK